MSVFDNKIVLVTGASLGIGLQISKQFAAQGATVAMAAGNRERLARAVAEVCAHAKRDTAGVGFRCDLADSALSDALLEAVYARLSRVDILVNNVGAFSEKHGWNEIDPALWHETFELNTLCAYRCTVGVCDRMRARGQLGCVVNIGSSAALRLKRGRINYTVSKCALHAMSQVLALDLAPYGIRVNVVSPGPTATEKVRSRIDDPAQAAPEAERLRKIPLGRYASPSDIADAVLFLASDRASFITGAVLPVDGGYTIGEPY